MSDPVNLTIFLLIVLSRLAVPLLIPRYPLPAIITALILDGVDGDIFNRFTTLPLDNYQSYDKALDIYYLTIAYLSTMRNWSNPFAFEVGRFLIYYRLVGVLLFEVTQARWMLFVFPNTFEYFFIFIELVRLRWNPAKLSRKLIYGSAAAIWVVIKLPQEYWIHVAQRDVTDTLGKYPVLIPILAVVLVSLALLVRWILTNRVPAPDHALTFDAGHPLPEEVLAGTLRQYRSLNWRAQRLPEKIVLVSLVSVIFSQILPQTQLGNIEILIGIVMVIIANTFVTEWLSHRGSVWRGAVRQFLTMAIINLGITILLLVILPVREEPMVFGNFVFFLFLVSLLITLFDLFLSIYQARDESNDNIRIIPV